MKDAHVLVTGATGFTGSLLTEKLCKMGAYVTAIHRRDNIPENLSSLPIKWLKGNVYDQKVIRKGCDGVEIIFHIAGAYREPGIPDGIYHKVHVESTKLLANEAVSQSSFHRFVHVSTIGVHGHIKNIPADEKSPYNPGDIYQETKTEAEKWILNFSSETKMPLTVVRPAAIYGPGDKRLLKLFRMARLPVVPIIGFSSGYYHLIHVDDLTDFMVLAAKNEKAVGEVFICGNEHSVRIKEMVKVIAKELGRDPRFIHLPATPFFSLAWMCESICRPFGWEPPIYRRRVAFFTKDRSFDTAKMRNLLNFSTKFKNEDGLKQTCNWYQKHGWL